MNIQELLANQPPFTGYNFIKENEDIISEHEQKLKYPDNTFNFYKLPNALHEYVLDFFSYNELGLLASTCRKNTSMFVDVNGKFSPYILRRLKSVKSLICRELYSLKKICKVTDNILILKECIQLEHFTAFSPYDAENYKIASINDEEIKDNIKLFPNLKYLSVITVSDEEHLSLISAKQWEGIFILSSRGNISSNQLECIATHCSQLTQLHLLSLIESDVDIMSVLRKLKNLNCFRMPFGYLEIDDVKELIDRKVFVECMDGDVQDIDEN